MRSIIIFCLFLMAVAGRAQDFASDLDRKLRQYYEKNVPLKAHVFLNQPAYAPGDTIFFGARLVTAQGLRPVAGRSIIHVKLLNGGGDVVSAESISVRDGFGTNFIRIPDALAADTYYFVAHNQWMRNTDSSLFFYQPIPIGLSKSEAKTPQPLLAFPEGGSLIAGMNAKVALQGSPGARAQLRANGKTLQEAVFNQYGVALVYMLPEPGTVYEVTSGNEKISLPPASADGAVISTSLLKDNNAMRAIIQVPPASRFRNEDLRVILSGHIGVVFSADVRMRDRNFATVQIPLTGLPAGVARLTLFDQSGKAVTERLVFIDQPSAPLVVSLDKGQYAPREKVKVNVRIREAWGNPAPSTLSATAFNNDLTPFDSTTATLLDNLYLRGDLGAGTARFFTTDGKVDSRALHDYLLTARWRRFSWDQMEGVTNQHIFNQQIHFSGRAFFKSTGEPVPDSTSISIFMQRTVIAYNAYTSKGLFDILMLFDFYGDEEIYFKALYRGKELDGVVIEDLNQANPSVSRSTGGDRMNEYSDFHSKRSQINASYRYFQHAATGTRTPPRSTIEQEIGGADLTINLSDYLLFPTMSETLREVVPLLTHRAPRGVDVVSLYNDELSKFFDDEPVYVVDGVMTDHTSYFLGLNPAQVASIKLVYSSRKINNFGAIGSNGIVIVETKIPGNATNVPRSMSSMVIRGLNKAKNPVVVAHDRPTRVPDLRTNLYWNTITTNASGEATFEFYTSDVPGNYKLRLEGVTSQGRLFTGEAEFSVVFNAGSN